MPLAPPKTKTEDVEVEKINVVEPLQFSPDVDIKHVIRGISTTGVFDEHNAHPASVVEDHIKSNYLMQGYKLVYIQYLRTVYIEQKPIAEMMLYVLVKESS